jgi:LacI family transcriptional regulator
VAIWPQQDYGRRVMLGAIEYGRSRALGEIELLSIQKFDELRERTAALDGTIVVLDPRDTKYIEPIRGTKVFVPRLSAPGRCPSVAADARAAAEMTAQHFLSRHICKLAVLAPSDAPFATEFRAAFAAAVAAAGADLLDAPSFTGRFPVAASSAESWMRSLPSSCGLAGLLDSTALNLARLAAACGRQVPRDIAIMGSGDDNFLCMLSRPTLTGLSIPAERIGYLAAELLDRKLRGEPVQSIRVAPVGVTFRESTDTLAIRDEAVAEAMRYVHSHASDPITVADVSRSVGIPRTTLQTRFRILVGRSIHEEIVLCRLNMAKSMLANTADPIKKIAVSVGIPDLPHFSRFIRKHTGHPPRVYRWKLGGE